MKERKKGIVPTMVWLSSYQKPITIYEMNKKLYPPDKKKHSPTSSHGYKSVSDLIKKKYVIAMPPSITLTNKTYIRGTPKPLLKIIIERLKTKHKFLNDAEFKILKVFLYWGPVRDFIGSLATESNIYIEKEVNGYDLAVDWISSYLFSFKIEKEDAKKRGREIPPSAGLNLADYKRRVYQYVKRPKTPSLGNLFSREINRLSHEISIPLPSLKNIDFDGLEKVTLALPSQIVEKVASCSNEESKAFYLTGKMTKEFAEPVGKK